MFLVAFQPISDFSQVPKGDNCQTKVQKLEKLEVSSSTTTADHKKANYQRWRGLIRNSPREAESHSQGTMGTHRGTYCWAVVRSPDLTDEIQ